MKIELAAVPSLDSMRNCCSPRGASGEDWTVSILARRGGLAVRLGEEFVENAVVAFHFDPDAAGLVADETA